MNQTSEPSLRETIAFTLPFVVFLVISQFAPSTADWEGIELGAGEWHPANFYFGLVGIQVLLATGFLWFFRRVYLQHFPFRVSWLSIVVGVVGVVVWVLLCQAQLEAKVLQAIGLGEWAQTRPGFNPFLHLEEPALRNVFLGLRFTLLALLVPIVEELFLRGWLVRWYQNPAWESIRLKDISGWSLWVPSIYGVLTHPSEAIAAFVWFGLVTLLMKRTGNLWDCVIAHGVTNLLLGIYVVAFSAWQLW